MTTTAEWHQAAIDCVDLYGGTIAEYLVLVPDRPNRVIRSERKLELPSTSIECAISGGLTRLAKLDFDDTVPKKRYKIVETPLAVISLTILFAKHLGIKPPLPMMIRPATTKDFDLEHEDEILGLWRGDVPDGLRERFSSSIYILDRPIGKALGTVAHEVCHAWQYANDYLMSDSDAKEADANAFQDAVLAAFSLPQYADLLIDNGPPPQKHGQFGSLFGLFHYDCGSGVVRRCYGDAPWPRWEYHRTVDLGIFA